MKSLVHLTTIILVVALTVSEAAPKKPRHSRADSTEPLSSAETHAGEPPATVRPIFNKSGKGVVKKFVKVNRLSSSSSSSKQTSIENAASTSVQYHSQSLLSTANQRPTTQLPLTTSAVFVSRQTAGPPAAWSSSAPIRAVSAAQTATATAVTRAAASTTPLTTTTTTTVAPTASPFRRVLRTSGTGAAHIKPLSSGGGAVRPQHHDSQPQASLLTKKAYTANQFADDDEDDYFSRRRARFLFKSRVGK